MMRAIVAPRAGVLEIADVPVPTISSRGVLIRNHVSAVSPRSELRDLFQGTGFPRIGGTGYMASGDVESVGAEVNEFVPGDRVTYVSMEPYGVHAEFCVSSPELMAHLPPEMSYLTGACSYWAVSAYRGILGSSTGFYDDSAVIGLGPLGLSAVQMLRLISRRVFAVDTHVMRCNLARELGADWSANPRTDNVLEIVRSHMPNGPKTVLELSGTQEGLEEALLICAPNGGVVIIGVLPRLNNLELFRSVQDKGIRLFPMGRTGESLSPEVDGRSRYMSDILDMIQRGKLNVDRLASWVECWTEGPRLIPRLREARDEAVGMALIWDY